MAENKKGTTIIPAGRASQTNEANLPRRGSENPKDLNFLTTQDLNSILEVNQKALTIYLEVESQNEHIITNLKDNTEKMKKFEMLEDEIGEVRRDLTALNKSTGELEDLGEDIKKKLDNLDRNMFRLLIFLGTVGGATVISLIQTFLKK